MRLAYFETAVHFDPIIEASLIDWDHPSILKRSNTAVKRDIFPAKKLLLYRRLRIVGSASYLGLRATILTHLIAWIFFQFSTSKLLERVAGGSIIWYFRALALQGLHLFLLFDIQLRCIRSFSAWWFREARIGAAYVPLYEVVRGNNKKVKSSFMWCVVYLFAIPSRQCSQY